MLGVAGLATAVALTAVLAVAGAAVAITPTITEYSTANGLNANSIPRGIVAGRDGNLWFSDGSTSKPAIGRINPGTQAISEVPNPGSNPLGIALGPDGNFWFADQGATKGIGRITPSGAITEFLVGASSFTTEITAGPDGNLWFSDQGTTKAIGRVTTTGMVTEFTTANGLNPGGVPFGIVTGPDGNVWFTDVGAAGAIGRSTPSGSITEFPVAGSSPNGIAVGPDGNLWFADGSSTHPALGMITRNGAVSEFSSGLNQGSSPLRIAAGPDGSLWFTDLGKTRAIGRIDPTTHTISEFSSGLPTGTFPYAITVGSDGNLWFTDEGTTPAIGRITTPPTAATASATVGGATKATVTGRANGHAQTTSFHVEYGPVGGATTTTPEHVLGAISTDTAVSAVLTGLRPGTAYRARVAVTNPTGTTPGAYLSFKTRASPGRPKRPPPPHPRPGPGPAPVLSRLTLTPPTFRTAATISYRDSEAATTTFTVLQRRPGIRKGKRCVKAPKHPPAKRGRCMRLVVLGSFTNADRAGDNRLRFAGRVRGRKLKPGRYQLRAVARNGAGQTGRAVLTRFRIKR
jgi:virginiamycin B lyase